MIGHRDAIVLFALAVGAVFAASGTTPLFDQDEAAYAGFAHRMLTTRDWLTIDFLWSDIHRKPPMHFWLIAQSGALLGEGLFSLRLTAALAFLGTVGVLAVWGAPLFGADRARRAAIVMATSLMPIIGKIALTDASLLLAQTLAALALLHRRPLILWLAVAVGMLIKGPPILILIGGMGAVLLLLSPPHRTIRLWWGAVLAPIPLLIWGFLSWQQDDGALVRWMVDWYILRRAEGTLGHTGPPGYYLVTFVLFLFPWTAFLFQGLWQTARRRDPLDPHLIAWMVGGWLIYAIIPSKLPAYAAGAWPAIALVIAGQLEQPVADSLGRALTVLVAALIGGGLFWIGTPTAIGVGALLLLSTALIVTFQQWRWAGLIAPLLLMAVWWGVLPDLHQRLFVTHRLAQVAARFERPVSIAHNYRLPSLGVYLAWRGVPIEDVPDAVQITDGPDRPSPDAIPVDGWIPDKGAPIRFWVVP
ncbi:MAG: glycosyltransferase family 39 protein [Myxococcota bacterium]